MLRGQLQLLARQRANFQGLQQPLGEAAAHLHVVAGGALLVVLAVGPPVGGDQALEAPLPAEYAAEHVVVLAGAVAVDDVVAGHDAPHVVVLHDDLEGLQVDLAYGALGGAGVAFLAVGLLVVQGQVLGGGGHAVGLHAADQRAGQVAGQQRVLGVVLEVPAAQRVAVDVHARGQPGADVVLPDLLAGGAAHGLGDLGVPGAGQQAGAGEGGGLDAHTRQYAHARGAVGGHHVGHAVLRQIAVAVGVGDARVGLAAQQPGQVLVGERPYEFVQRQLALGHVNQLGVVDVDRPPAVAVVGLAAPNRGHQAVHVRLIHRRQGVGVGVEGRAGGQRLVAAVGQHALFQLGGGHTGGQLLDHPRFVQAPGVVRRPGAHVRAHEEAVVPRLQQPGGLLDLAQVVVGGHPGHGAAQLHPLALAGQQLARLLPAAQLAGRLAQLALGRGEVELHDLLAGEDAGVGHGQRRGEHVAVEAELGRGQLEAGVGQAEAEGVVHLRGRAGHGLKVAVAHVDVVLVVHEGVRLVEVVRGGVVFQRRGEGVRQLARGGVQPQQQLGLGQAALHARLPGHQRGVDAGIVPEEGRVEHAAHVQHHDHGVEGGLDLVHHVRLGVVQVEVALGEHGLGQVILRVVHPHARVLLDPVKGALAVPALAGEAADGDDGRVGKGRRPLDELIRQLGLVHGAGLAALGVAGADVLAVEGVGALEQRHPVRILLHAVGQVAGVGHGHVAAAAAALHVVVGALAEQRHLRAAAQRQRCVLVLQQHHALPGGVQAQFDVLRSRREAPAVGAQGQVGMVVDAIPLVHGRPSFL